MLISETSKTHQTSSTNGDVKLVLPAKYKATGFSFLKKTYLRKITNWSFGYLNQNQVLFSDNFQQVKIGTFLTRSKNAIKIQDSETYRRVTIKLYGNGVKIRDEVEGKEIGTKSQFLVSEGQFILSRIDARNGAFAIATKEIDGAIVTNDFPVYDINENLINPNYFSLLISTKRFASYFQGLSSGTTNRQRINETDFLEMEVPLPPIATQEKLVADYNAQMLQAEANEKEASKKENEIEAYLLKELGIKIQQTEKKDWHCFKLLKPTSLKRIEKWGVSFLLGKTKVERAKFEIKKISELCKIGSGGTPSRTNSKYFDGNIPWVKSTEVVNSVIFDTEEKITPFGLKNSSAKLYPANSLIIAMYGQGTTRARTAKLAIEATTNQACAVLSEIDNNLIEIDFLWLYLQGEYERLRELASGNNQPNLNAQMIADYPVVIPPKKIQNKIVNHINNLKAEIKTLNFDAKDLRNKAKGEFESELFEM